MSLQVWLPLNGDTHNQGLCNITITNNGAAINNNGKIGKCYYFDGTATNYMNTTYSTAIGTSDFSIAMWIKIPTMTSGTYYAICTSKTTAAASAGFGIYWNYSQKKFLWSTADGSSATEIWMAQTVDSIVYDKWIHLVMVRNSNDSKKGYFYINGQRYELASVPAIRNITTDTKLFIGRCTGGSYLAKMYLNDFRIYDHALSDKEVEEIAKGLVLHYKLDDTYIENSNIISCNITETAYNAPISKYGYNDTSNLIKTTGNFQGKNCVKIGTRVAGQQACPYAYFGNLFTSDGTNAPAYKALSFDYYTTVPTTTWLNIYKLGSGQGTATWKTINSDGVHSGIYTNSANSIIVKPNEWNHVEVIFHGTTAANAEWGYCINGPNHVSSEEYYFLYANIQLEENDHVTGYGENMHSNIVYDSSGYNNNGLIFNPLTITTDTLKYNVATVFDGNTSAIKVPYTNIASTDDIFTLNLWFKKDDLGSKNYETLFGGPSGFEMDTRAGAATSLTLYMASTRGSNFAQFNFGEWYMVTLVNDGTNELYYVNTELKKTIEKKPMPAGNYYIGAWQTEIKQNYKGFISDFRIYKTALTLEQIQELYHTSATIDNKGNVYAREVVE